MFSQYFAHDHKVSRLVLHPDTLTIKTDRDTQIEMLACSLSEMAEKINGIDFICIEPRGGDKQRKVLRANIWDLQTLQDYLSSFG